MFKFETHRPESLLVLGNSFSLTLSTMQSQNNYHSPIAKPTSINKYGFS